MSDFSSYDRSISGTKTKMMKKKKKKKKRRRRRRRINNNNNNNLFRVKYPPCVQLTTDT